MPMLFLSKKRTTTLYVNSQTNSHLLLRGLREGKCELPILAQLQLKLIVAEFEHAKSKFVYKEVFIYESKKDKAKLESFMGY